jgi:solute carrier family 25 (mitochondrial folate transporter), member 32
MVYEEMKAEYNHFKKQPIDSKLVRFGIDVRTPLLLSFCFSLQGSGEYIFFAAWSKLIAAVTTYPYQVVRARLQDHHSVYAGAIDCVRKTVRYEGVAGLYKGISPYLIHVLPNICMVLLIYEKMSNL